ncbi:hypothetical protein [Bradyrhizobium sp.]|uniref:hypothetical protein n=1 Tax=Bradyrhizobium sp. TaxID=376 RepID=UPI003C74930D
MRTQLACGTGRRWAFEIEITGTDEKAVNTGYVSDRFGSSIAFTGLAGIAAAGLATIWLAMPETRRGPRP